MTPLSRLRRLPPSYCVRGDNASARYKPEHGVHPHGLLRGRSGSLALTLSWGNQPPDHY